MKVIKVFYGIGLFIIVCGISLMLTSMAFRNQPDIKLAYLDIGLLIGVTGVIILVITNKFDKDNKIKLKDKSDEIKRGNQK